MMKTPQTHLALPKEAFQGAQQTTQRCTIAEAVSMVEDAEPDFRELMNIQPRQTPADSAKAFPSMAVESKLITSGRRRMKRLGS